MDKEKLIELLKLFPGNPKVKIGLDGQRAMLEIRNLVGCTHADSPMGILTTPGQDIPVDTIGIML